MPRRAFDFTKDVIAPVFLSLLVFAGGLVLSVGTYSAARNYETALFPVIEDFEITNPRVTETRLRFTPKFNKVRDCQFVEKSWYVTLDDGSARQVYVGFPDQKAGDQTAPVGLQTRSDFEVGQGEWPTAVSQRGYVFHDCWGYKIRTKLGPFPIYK